ncbi:MAG: alkaline phosphatase family protein [Chitinophagales bacterium]|nr:alkaline phosphatase family protein [Chitinophagales bacterium]MDW8393033.1 alkaline phosphatase family protein [Chitinophagales bacterium]
MGKRIAKRLLLIGWDAADWKVINPLLDQGLMPTLESLVNQGVMGNIATLDPPLSPILWSSIATGKLGDKHGVLGFVEPDVQNSTIRPVQSTSRKVKAIWNILSQCGLKCNVVGWWPSHPAEHINGVMVSNFYQKSKGYYDDPWPMAAGTVWPSELADTLAELRVHPAELSEQHILPFIPEASKSFDMRYMPAVGMLANILAHTASVHNAATYLMRNTEWDFMAVYYDAIDHFCHGFMKFHPPQRKGIPDELFRLFKDVVSSAYRYHDMMLQRLLDLAGNETTVLLLSDHGFHSDHLRPNRLPREPAGPAFEHSPFGIICLKGPGICVDERVYGATLLDVAPTVLTLFGLPVGKDMDGKPLLQVFHPPVTAEYIDSWEEVDGPHGMHPSDQQEDPWAAQQALQQLIELGYVEDPGPDKKKAMEKNARESQYYRARILMFRRDYAAAADILERIYAEDQQMRFGLSLLTCYQQLRDPVKFRTAFDEVKKFKEADLVQLDVMEAALLLLEHKPRQALDVLHKAREKSAHLPLVHTQIGRMYLRTHRNDDALQAFLMALEIDPNLPAAHHGLSVVYLRQGRYEEAAEEALNAIGLQYHMPQAHYCLGEALMHLQIYDRAAEAFEVCCSMMPGNRKAHLWLIELYEKHLNQTERAQAHRQFIAERIKGTITIVSGLPRSGTSMMMQMLAAAGLPLLTDEQRKPDASNPRGYFEYEKTKRLLTDASWLHEAVGKVVKIVAPLLVNLPPKYDYRILFMKRDLGEILRSQQIMLGKDPTNYPLALAEAFAKQLEKCEAMFRRMPNVEVLYVSYADAVANPLETAETVAAFLHEDLDVEKMAAAVDKSLYRNQISASPTG